MTIETEQIGLRLKLELVDKLRSYCSEEGRSQTWVIDKALNQYLSIISDVNKSVARNTKIKHKLNQPIAEVDNSDADIVISVLNKNAGTKYRFTASNRKLINARLKDYNLTDACQVIDKKCGEWKGTEMARYLRPSTLFNATKFEEYLNQKIIEGNKNGTNRFSKPRKETDLEAMSREQKAMDARREASRNHEQVLGENGSIVSTQIYSNGR